MTSKPGHRNKRDKLRREAAEAIDQSQKFEDGAILDKWRRIVESDISTWELAPISLDAGRDVILSKDALKDLETLALLTDVAWGMEVSLRYLDHMKQEIVMLASSPGQGEPFDPLPGWYGYIAASFSEKKAGQLIIHRPVENGIAIAFFENFRGPHLPTVKNPKLHALCRRLVVGPEWAGCDPLGRLI